MTVLKSILAAFQFLTILPLPVRTEKKHLEKSMVWFPLVGALTGLVTGFGYYWLSRVFPSLVSAALTICLYILFTRGLHLDGFMDTIDGFFSHRPKEKVLAIMKDPVVGSFAVLGIGIWFLVLASALPYLAPLDHIALHVFSRTAIILMPLFYPYPRESGTGRFFAENVSPRTFVGASFLAMLLVAGTLFLGIPGSGKILGSGNYWSIWVYMGLLSIAFLTAFSIGHWANRKIGGITGDVLGFTLETIHLLLVLIVVALVFGFQ